MGDVVAAIALGFLILSCARFVAWVIVKIMATPRPRAVICIWCKQRLVHEATSVGQAKAWTAMKLHDTSCPKNPYRKVVRALSKDLDAADRNVIACLDVLASLSAHASPSGRLWFGEPGSGPAYSDDAEKAVGKLLAERKKAARPWCTRHLTEAQDERGCHGCLKEAAEAAPVASQGLYSPPSTGGSRFVVGASEEQP